VKLVSPSAFADDLEYPGHIRYLNTDSKATPSAARIRGANGVEGPSSAASRATESN
jgi:hypothetical protein